FLLALHRRLLYVFTLYYFIVSFFFFFNDPATTEIYTLSLHDALPISPTLRAHRRACDVDGEGMISGRRPGSSGGDRCALRALEGDRKSTRLNSSHDQISYAVFCLKKKKKKKNTKKKIKTKI